MSDEELLKSWTKPSSDTEQDKQDRTQRMVQEAIDNHSAFNGCPISVYPKGSYPNNTNVKAESDVDIAVQCGDVFYHDTAYESILVPGDSYKGPWTPEHLRTEVARALTTRFGNQVDASGNVAIKVTSSTARVDADVIPCFNYRYYSSASNYVEGAYIVRRDMSTTFNYPQLHLECGRAKNNDTHTRYKKTVRILKRAANAMESAQYHRETVSYFVESLVFNCPDNLFGSSTWTDITQQILYHIWSNTQGDAEPSAEHDRWVEADGAKFLFHHKQRWSRRDGREFAKAAWNYLGFDGS